MSLSIIGRAIAAVGIVLVGHGFSGMAKDHTDSRLVGAAAGVIAIPLGVVLARRREEDAGPTPPIFGALPMPRSREKQALEVLGWALREAGHAEDCAAVQVVDGEFAADKACNCWQRAARALVDAEQPRASRAA